MSCTQRLAWLCWIVTYLGFDGSARAESPLIYRCERQGQPVFSDRPCDGTAQMIALDQARTNVYQHRKYDERVFMPASSKHARTKATQRAAPVENEDKHRAACARIDQSIDSVRSKQRAGYHAKEGVRLDERLRRLEDERRVKRCAH